MTRRPASRRTAASRPPSTSTSATAPGCDPTRDKPERRSRKGLLIGGGVAVLALAGGGVWAWTAFFSQGPQPAEALPDSTLAYVSIDLDPPGQQKVEAIKTLRKFPAFRDEIGLDTDDDVRKEIFGSLQDEGLCEDVDYADDVEPWLGDRAAFALVDQGKDRPAPVFVVQIKDQDEAEDGLEKLTACARTPPAPRTTSAATPSTATGWCSPRPRGSPRTSSTPPATAASATTATTRNGPRRPATPASSRCTPRPRPARRCCSSAASAAPAATPRGPPARRPWHRRPSRPSTRRPSRRSRPADPNQVARHPAQQRCHAEPLQPADRASRPSFSTELPSDLPSDLPSEPDEMPTQLDDPSYEDDPFDG